MRPPTMVVVAAIGFLLTGCAPRTRVIEYKPSAPQPVRVISIPPEWHLHRSDRGPHDHMRLVIRDSSAWRLLWSRVHWHDTRRPAEPLDPPPVDFREFVVVVASIGYRGCDGYSIRMDSLYLTPEQPARILVTTTSPPDIPGRGCLGLMNPVDIVRIPVGELGPLAHERALAFEERIGVATASTRGDTVCTYERCSLWLDRGALVQGAQARAVARGGFFRPLRVLPFLTGDSARHYGALYERSARRASRLSLGALTLVVAGVVVGLAGECHSVFPFDTERCPDDASGPMIASGLVLAGYTLEVISFSISGRGYRSLGRALWWHNRQYAR